MFVHQSKLEHLLSPVEYWDAEVAEAERRRLFLPGWHLLATRSELPRSGDFLTRDVLGEPVLVRNHEGELHAYLNVCAHRHCRITNKACGHDPHFRCQYHGWEFKPDGRTAHIPDARCFRPWDRENARLVKFRTEAWGDMTFVSLRDDGMSLRDALGPLYERAGEWLGPPFRFARHWQWDYAANWKVVIENTLESYHLPMLHAKSLGKPPTEEACEHVLDERYSTFHVPETYGWVSRIQNFLVRSLGGAVTNVYAHHLAHPNLWFVAMDTFRLVQVVLPTSPTTCRHRAWLYTLEGTRHNPWAWLVRQVLDWFVIRTSHQVLSEDMPIFPEVQAGMAASRARGVIGTREERVYAFQQFVRAALDESE